MAGLAAPSSKWCRRGCVFIWFALHVAFLVYLSVMKKSETPALPTSPCQLHVRSLASTLWGFLVTLIALCVDSWGSTKNETQRFAQKLLRSCMGVPLDPIGSVTEKMKSEYECCTRLTTELKDYPSAKPYIRILSGCHVFVNISCMSYKKYKYNCHILWGSRVHDFSDAIRIGSQVEGENLLELSPTGKQALIHANVLPPVEQLKILQGQSGLAVAATLVQAVGYMYGGIVRLALHLRVSPVEALAFALNILVVVKGVWHFIASTCHRPLILILDRKQEDDFVAELEKLSQARVMTATVREMVTMDLPGVGTIVLFEGMLMFSIVMSAKNLPFVFASPMLIILVCFPFLEPISSILERTRLDERSVFVFFFYFSRVLHVAGYALAITVTIIYWNSVGFNIQSSIDLPNFLPYVG